VEFLESPPFTRYVAAYLDDDSYLALQQSLIRDPERGDVIPGTGGFRKLRWKDPRRGKGSRGGFRVIYYYFSPDHQIWLMMIYSKGAATDLTPNDKKALRAAIELESRARKSR